MPRRKKVLLVDDEPGVLLGLMRTLLRDNAFYDVMVAITGEIAQQIMREQPIHVLITDISMPGLSGIDLLLWAARETPETQVAVISAGDVDELRDKAYGLGAVSIIKKPFQVAQVRELVLSMLDSDAFMSGRLARLSVADLVQMLCLSRQTVVLRIEQEDESGMLMINRGQLHHAVWGEERGEPALFRALRVENGTFHTHQFPADAPQTIEGDWQQLLIEGMRQLDEHTREFEGDGSLLELIEDSLFSDPQPPPPPGEGLFPRGGEEQTTQEVPAPRMPTAEAALMGALNGAPSPQGSADDDSDAPTHVESFPPNGGRRRPGAHAKRPSAAVEALTANLQRATKMARPTELGLPMAAPPPGFPPADKPARPTQLGAAVATDSALEGRGASPTSEAAPAFDAGQILGEDKASREPREVDDTSPQLLAVTGPVAAGMGQGAEDGTGAGEAATPAAEPTPVAASAEQTEATTPAPASASAGGAEASASPALAKPGALASADTQAAEMAASPVEVQAAQAASAAGEEAVSAAAESVGPAPAETQSAAADSAAAEATTTKAPKGGNQANAGGKSNGAPALAGKGGGKKAKAAAEAPTGGPAAVETAAPAVPSGEGGSLVEGPVLPAPDPVKALKLLQDGFTLLRKGDRPGAILLWKAAHLADPDNQVVVVNLKKLESAQLGAARKAPI